MPCFLKIGKTVLNEIIEHGNYVEHLTSIDFANFCSPYYFTFISQVVSKEKIIDLVNGHDLRLQVLDCITVV